MNEGKNTRGVFSGQRFEYLKTFATFSVMGAGANWVFPTALAQQIPYFQMHNPEGLCIATYMNAATNIGIFAVIFYLLFLRYRGPCPHYYSVPAILITSAFGSYLSSAIYSKTVNGVSIYLFLCCAIGGSVGAISSVAMNPFLTQFENNFISASRSGGSACMLLSAVIALVQSPGSVNQRFSTTLYLLIFSGILTFPVFAYMYLTQNKLGLRTPHHGQNEGQGQGQRHKMPVKRTYSNSSIFLKSQQPYMAAPTSQPLPQFSERSVAMKQSPIVPGYGPGSGSGSGSIPGSTPDCNSNSSNGRDTGGDYFIIDDVPVHPEVSPFAHNHYAVTSLEAPTSTATSASTSTGHSRAMSMEYNIDADSRGDLFVNQEGDRHSAYYASPSFSTTKVAYLPAGSTKEGIPRRLQRYTQPPFSFSVSTENLTALDIDITVVARETFVERYCLPRDLKENHPWYVRTLPYCAVVGFVNMNTWGMGTALAPFAFNNAVAPMSSSLAVEAGSGAGSSGTAHLALAYEFGAIMLVLGDLSTTLFHIPFALGLVVFAMCMSTVYLAAADLPIFHTDYAAPILVMAFSMARFFEAHLVTSAYRIISTDLPLEERETAARAVGTADQFSTTFGTVISTIMVSQYATC